MLGTVIESQHQMRSDIHEMRSDVRGLQVEVGELRREMSSMKKDVASLPQAVTEYHSSVLGHGILISDLEDRVRRIEDHLHLPPAA